MALCALAITIYKNTQTHSEAEVKSKSEKHHGTTKKHIQSRIDTLSLSLILCQFGSRSFIRAYLH